MQERLRRRSIHILLLAAAAFAVMELRLAWLQLGPVRGHAARAGLPSLAYHQRADSIVIDSGRGLFLDRRGRIIAGEVAPVMAAFPEYGMPRGTKEQIRQAAGALGVSAEELEAWLRELKTPEVWRKPGSRRPEALTEEQAETIRDAGLIGVHILPQRIRYPEDIPPMHAIGFLSQDPERLARLYPRQVAKGKIRETDLIGGAGLERSLDRLIRGAGPTVVSRVTDGTKRPLEGLGLRTISPGNPHFPLMVRTTIDLDIQRAAHKALEEAGVREGAVVVLDAASADILAMVSYPPLDPYRIGAPGTDVRNRAITAYAPGSVFKTVTMAAALEAGIANPDTAFFCDGEYERYGLKCWLQGGHGHLTLEEAFAQSCNVTFAAIAEKLDPAWIQITAERLGLGRKVGWAADSFMDGKPLRLLEEEEGGTIFLQKKTAYDGGVRAGTGIGQRDVRVTPLQAANMVVSVLNGGRVASPRIVSEIRYADGNLAAELPKQTADSKYGRIRPETARALLKAMRLTVTAGTASGALSGASWPLAGKSGTAELAGASQGRNDHWFVGYGPAEGTPRYAVAVLIREQPAGLRNRAAAVFGAVMERLRRLDLQASGHQGAEDPAGIWQIRLPAAESTGASTLDRTTL